MSTAVVLLLSIVFAPLIYSSGNYRAVKAVTLTPNNTNESGANINVLHSDVTTTTQQWNIVTTNQFGFQLRISLDSTWGFVDDEVSELWILFNNNTDRTLSHGQLLTSFSVNDTQYLTTLVNPIRSSVSPNCRNRPISGDVASQVSQTNESRIQKATYGGTLHDWPIYLNAMEDYNTSWPLLFRIVNYGELVGDHMILDLFNEGWPTHLHCRYESLFPSNQGLDIYIAAADNGDALNITEIHLQYFYDLTYAPTIHPTDGPTTHPTIEPTIDPIQGPTTEASVNATYAPTIHPRDDPTTHPTIEPTIEPTIGSTQDPTTVATVNATHKPSKDPTESSIRERTVTETTQTQIIVSESETPPDAPYARENIYMYISVCLGSIICIYLIYKVAKKVKKSRVPSADVNVKQHVQMQMKMDIVAPSSPPHKKDWAPEPGNEGVNTGEMLGVAVKDDDVVHKPPKCNNNALKGNESSDSEMPYTIEGAPHDEHVANSNHSDDDNMDDIYVNEDAEPAEAMGLVPKIMYTIWADTDNGSEEKDKETKGDIYYDEYLEAIHNKSKAIQPV